MNAYVTGFGAALPARVVTNGELSPLLGVSEEWIESSSSIRTRHWASPDEATSDLAAAAVREALEDAGTRPEDADYLIACTLSPDYQVPGIAPLVQRKVPGMGAVPALDLRAGCASILYALQVARALVRSETAATVVCLGAEAQSKGLDLSPASREISALFGDGAGAVVVRGDAGTPAPKLRLRIDDVLIGTDGDHAEALGVLAPGTGNGARWLDPADLDAGRHRPAMQGRAVILHAVRKMADAAGHLLERNGLSIEDVGQIVPHQANGNLIRALAARLGVPEGRVVVNVDRLGNTSCASPFLALYDGARADRFAPGSKALVVAFGAGFTWGGALLTVER